ncbi:hypothetical protein ERX46_07800 [Brumimicrobium glaciale]|jgi:hypothetical protein|uniref:Uncharacterized protein n=1 Tax=Brumimicrobium glaciale TaxID=200475 RepID=A0A4Q4KPD4_9FLAO|nr:hypothetical protein [Brumimicrobium glaciale]RYM33859.1 hypothetical protein ERX46_07800 [Brumimicrobium glaciale]
MFWKAVIDNCQLLGFPKQLRLVTENSNSKIGLAHNCLGELIIEKNGQSINQIDVEKLNKGIYVV